MSHSKNMQAFGKLTGICTGLGGNYNPGQQNLQVNAMTTMLNIAQQIGEEVKEAQYAYDFATNQRVEGFRGIRHLSSRIYGMLKASGIDLATLEDARNSKRKIWGLRTPKPLAVATENAEAEKKATAFTYGRDFAAIASYFAKLTNVAVMEGKYQPNEPDLTVVSLVTKLEQLQTLNQAVTEAEIRLEKARRERNNVYYLNESNLIDTALTTKLYIRSAFGYKSQEHQDVMKLKFTKPDL